MPLTAMEVRSPSAPPSTVSSPAGAMMPASTAPEMLDTPARYVSATVARAPATMNEVGESRVTE